MKQIKFLILSALFLVAGFLLGYGFRGAPEVVKPVGSSSAIGHTTSMMIDTGSELLGFPERSVNEGDTVWSQLERAAQENEALTVASDDFGDLGILIKSINGYENGVDNNYWQFWVNNKYADSAANNYHVSPGDVILWKFTSNRYQAYE